MDEAKRTYREAEEGAKEAWRKADGESPADAIGNAGDEIRKELGNAGDDLREAGDDLHRSQHETMDNDKAAWRRSDGDESLADKVGNAGDDVRRELGQR